MVSRGSRVVVGAITHPHKWSVVSAIQVDGMGWDGMGWNGMEWDG